MYFQNFWQLDVDNRRQLFEKVKLPGILALYSIATDLNKDKGGELAFYKEWRNGLEHKFLVVHKSDKSEGIYESYQLIKDILFIKESDFIRHFEHLLQITRSAIFSFAFMVRHEGMKEKRRVFTIRHENYIPKTIQQIKS
ncbi:LA2681 family HEPN domain-containing protein [Citrobacter meridianamericanus]|uniref:LA2681 family HEPN domain-containing protein n=1 Tax=Citrobacter meridianamericanus TaxID=2894201 RepID=UPI00351D3E94